MRHRFLGILFFFLVLGSGWSKEPAELGEPVLAEVVEALKTQTKVLSRISDLETLKDNAAELRKVKETPLARTDEAYREWFQKAYETSPELQAASKAQFEQIQRIEALGKELFIEVGFVITGERPPDYAGALRRSTTLLGQIKTERDLERVAEDLFESWGPMRKGIMEDPARFMNLIQGDPELRQLMVKQKEASQRLEVLDMKLAMATAEAMIGREAMRKMVEVREEAGRKAKLARARGAVIGAELRLLAELQFEARKPQADVVSVIDKNFVEKYKIEAHEFAAEAEEQFLDPWGKPVRAAINLNLDGQVFLPGIKEAIKRDVAVESAGPDGKFETVEDNVRSWEKGE